MKRLALLALLLASSSLVAAPAPVPKPQRKEERPPAQQNEAVVTHKVVMNQRGARQLCVRVRAGVFVAAQVPQPQQAPAQPPNADPPG